MREFITAAKEASETEDEKAAGTTFLVDGFECRCFKPKDGQLAVLMATTGRHSSNEESIAGYINFFVAVLDDESQSYIISRLLDRKDEFGIDQVQSIMEWMIEDWSGRPTQSPSVSTASPPSVGRKSTRPTQALTSSG